MIQFFAPDIAHDMTLPPSDSAHVVRVLRMRVGDTLYIVDGKGTRYRCALTVDDPRRAVVTVLDSEPVAKVWHDDITIAVAPTKHLDRMEWLVEKLVEIGVDRFVPIRCARSERKELKTERLEKIAVSAMKQSLKATLPVITEMTPLKQFLAGCDAAQRFVGYCDKDTPRRLLVGTLRPGLSTAILIGPEGDFTPDEIADCLAADFIPVTMGDNRLRTETAALVGCDTFHIINQLKQ